MDKSTVHLVDDEDTVRRAATFLLRSAGYEVRGYASGAALLGALDRSERGCVLLDARMPGMDGLQVLAELRARGNAMPVILLAAHGDVPTAVAAMKAGAVDLVEKPIDERTLLPAVEAAFRRRPGPRTLASAGDEDAQARIANLTAREQDVLRGLVRGQANKTIAHSLGISPRTVEVHRANVMGKLGVRSLPEALRVVFAAGFGADPADT